MKDDPEIIDGFRMTISGGELRLFITRRGVTEIQQRVPMRERVAVKPEPQDQFWEGR
jgi:hypothetical protein